MQLVSLNSTLDRATSAIVVSATVLHEGVATPLSFTPSHPRYQAALDLYQKFVGGASGVTPGDLAEELFALSDVGSTVQQGIRSVPGMDGRLTFDGRQVYVDGDPLDPSLNAHMLRMLDGAGTPKNAANWRAFVRFVENLYSNASPFVREQLFGWLNYENTQGHGFTLTDDGCFIGYKGCGGSPEVPMSINSGEAYVNGELKKGQIPNPLGAVVTMPRSSVQDDPSVGCSHGLHVGTYAYASGWAKGVLLTVKVNPRDVVSVPTECDAQKIRTCRYEVLEVVEKAYEAPTYAVEDFDEEDSCEDYEGCYDCDCGCDEGVDAAYDDLREAFEEAERDGARMLITYERADSSEREYVAQVEQADADRVLVTLEGGDYRTFLYERIMAFEEAPEDSEAERTLEEELRDAEGKLVSLVYRRPNGSSKEYWGTLEQMGPAYVRMTLDEGGNRTLRISEIINVEVVEDADEEDEPQAEALFGARLVNVTYRNPVGQVDSLRGTVWDKGDHYLLVTPEETYHRLEEERVLVIISDALLDPEAEEEIARHGYAEDEVDPWS